MLCCVPQRLVVESTTLLVACSERCCSILGRPIPKTFLDVRLDCLVPPKCHGARLADPVCRIYHVVGLAFLAS